MLEIRPVQMQAFEKAARAVFEDEMVKHSRAIAPPLCKVLGGKQLRFALRRMMRRADDHGFTNRGPIRLFIEMAFIFGSAFDTDPQYPWAGEILELKEDQMARAEKLYGRIVDFQKKVPGAQDVNNRRAAEEMLNWSRKPTVVSPEDFVKEWQLELNRIFPQKVAFIGEASSLALIQEGRGEGRKYRFPTTRGEGLLVLLMFGFGHGCARDPLYPWVGRTLRDNRIVDAAARAERLEKKAVTWLEHVLAQPSKETPHA